jgi:hypothetical protein
VAVVSERSFSMKPFLILLAVFAVGCCLLVGTAEAQWGSNGGHGGYYMMGNGSSGGYGSAGGYGGGYAAYYQPRAYYAPRTYYAGWGGGWGGGGRMVCVGGQCFIQ